MCAVIDSQMARMYQVHSARHAISIINRLKPGPFRVRHASRVFKNYNTLRREVRQIYQERAL